MPKPETLDLLIAPFETRVREELSTAYLSEHIPASVRESVRVSIYQSDGKPPVDLIPDQPAPGSDLERILRTLGREAVKNVNLYHILDHLAAPLENRKPLMEQEREDLTVFTVEEQARIEAAEKEVSKQERGEKAPKVSRTKYTPRGKMRE